MVPVVLHPANAAAARAVRPPNRLLPGLRGDDLLLNTRQQPLRLGQGQSQVGDIGDITRTIDLQDVRVRPLALSPSLYQPQHPAHASILGQRTDAKLSNLPPHPQSCDSPAVLVQLERQDEHPRPGRNLPRCAGSGRHWTGPCNKVTWPYARRARILPCGSDSESTWLSALAAPLMSDCKALRAAA